MTLFWMIYVFIIGLCTGSFLNVVILRGLSGESIVLPPSHCTKCNHKLAWYDNIPVFSYLFLRGKCRYCSEKISIQYPLVELFTGLIFAGIYYKYAGGSFNLNTLFLMIASSLCIVLAVTDIKEKVILDIHSFILAGLGLIYNFFNFAGENTARITFWIAGLKITISQAFIYSILGLILGFGLMAGISFILKLITKRDCFGEGDAYILGALGAFFGIVNAIVILILSIFIWGGFSVPAFMYRWFKNKDYKLLCSIVLFIIAAVLFWFGEVFNVFTSNLFHWFAFLLVAAIGLNTCRLIINSVKHGAKTTVIPYGPALIFAAFLIIFVF